MCHLYIYLVQFFPRYHSRKLPAFKSSPGIITPHLKSLIQAGKSPFILSPLIPHPSSTTKPQKLVRARGMFPPQRNLLRALLCLLTLHQRIKHRKHPPLINFPLMRGLQHVLPLNPARLHDLLSRAEIDSGADALGYALGGVRKCAKEGCD